MSRWITLTADHLKAAGHGAIVDQARTLATGGIDPVDTALANATARIRRAIAPGNVLDAAANKIPESFAGVGAQLALFALMPRIGLPLSDDQKQTQRDMTADLKSTADNKTKVELADDPESTPSMGATGMKATAVNVPRRQTGGCRTNGL